MDPQARADPMKPARSRSGGYVAQGRNQPAVQSFLDLVGRDVRAGQGHLDGHGSYFPASAQIRRPTDRADTKAPHDFGKKVGIAF